MIYLPQTLVVEGKYDQIHLSHLIGSPILPVDGGTIDPAGEAGMAEFVDLPF